MIAIIDYGAGNLGSVYKAFRYIGADVKVTREVADVASADRLVLPGVGAFTHCMQGLDGVHLVEATHSFIESGRPFLGICVGLQMLFDRSEEMGGDPGLGILSGNVVRFRFDEPALARLKVPHIGWNSVQHREGAELFAGVEQNARFYFVHSYYPEPNDETVVSATSEYGYKFCCSVQRDHLFATQFHPEKSGQVGLRILRNFASL